MARAFMMWVLLSGVFVVLQARSWRPLACRFGAPTHRLEAQIQATARVLEINCHCIYLPSLILISFGDTETHTCDIKFLKQANGLDLGKMNAAYHIYRKVRPFDESAISAAALTIQLAGHPRQNLSHGRINQVGRPPRCAAKVSGLATPDHWRACERLYHAQW
jgi:hypothetical protein